MQEDEAQVGRRLVICCDGTWNTPGNLDGAALSPTNVRKFYAALAERGLDGKTQVGFYRQGVGTRGGAWEKLKGGIFGSGLSQDIQSTYKWLAETWRAGDEIFVIGFSRGAYTARSLVGMIGRAGIAPLSTVEKEHRRWEIVRDMERLYRGRKDGPHPKPDIEFLGVWDTVGALGVPEDYALIDILFGSRRSNTFHDTELGKRVKCARHAVAIDEQRVDFVPTLWTNIGAPDAPEDVEQQWFPGVHGDLGGAYTQRGLGDAALRWMMEAAAKKQVAFRQTAWDDLQADPRGPRHDSVQGVFRHRRTRPRAVPNMSPAFFAQGQEETVDHGQSQLSDAAKERIRHPGIGEPEYWRTTCLGTTSPGNCVTVTVEADTRWNATRVFCRKGEKYRFTARGEWLDKSLRAGPDGVNRQWAAGMIVFPLVWGAEVIREIYRRVTGNDRAENLVFRFGRRHGWMPLMRLMGVVASGRGADEKTKRQAAHQSFDIGRGPVTLEIEADGYLYAYANDAWSFYSNNRGRVSLTIERVQ